MRRRASRARRRRRDSRVKLIAHAVRTAIAMIDATAKPGVIVKMTIAAMIAMPTSTSSRRGLTAGASARSRGADAGGLRRSVAAGPALDRRRALPGPPVHRPRSRRRRIRWRRRRPLSMRSDVVGGDWLVLPVGLDPLALATSPWTLGVPTSTSRGSRSCSHPPKPGMPRSHFSSPAGTRPRPQSADHPPANSPPARTARGDRSGPTTFPGRRGFNPVARRWGMAKSRPIVIHAGD